jgi:cell wall-associated NlpC family hydrolase
MTRIPLDPGAGGQSISIAALRVGDTVVSTTKATVSRVIRAATISDVSHSMIYVGDQQVVHAVSKGVVLETLTKALFDAILAVTYRHRHITHTQALRVRDFAGNQIGRKYSVIGALTAGTGDIAKCVLVELLNRDRFFCSELVFAAFKHAGLPLSHIPSECAIPNQIVKVRDLHYVGHLIV